MKYIVITVRYEGEPEKRTEHQHEVEAKYFTITQYGALMFYKTDFEPTHAFASHEWSRVEPQA